MSGDELRNAALLAADRTLRAAGVCEVRFNDDHVEIAHSSGRVVDAPTLDAAIESLEAKV